MIGSAVPMVVRVVGEHIFGPMSTIERAEMARVNERRDNIRLLT